MVKFLLWLLLLVVCWPLALLALVLWPVVWVLSLPFGWWASWSRACSHCCAQS